MRLLAHRWLFPLGCALALVALAAGLVASLDVWAAVYPRAPLLARAARWPLVGPWVERVRARHAEGPLPRELPPGPHVWVLGDERGMLGSPAAAGRAADTSAAAPPATDPPDLPAGVWPEVWLRPGDRLRAAPDAGAASVGEVSTIANVAVLAARGRWRRVLWHGVEGWVEANPDVGPPLGSAPEPVRPLPGRPPDPRRLAIARELLAGGGSERRVGPYALLTDLDEPALLAQLDRAASGLEEVYRRRYGVTPVGSPAEAVVLFARRADYEAYVARTGAPRAETGHVAAGVVAFYREGRLPEDVRATLVHELAHLLDRRALGPALPPWLDEGIADDLGQSRVDEDGHVLAGTLSAPTLRAGPFYEVHGGGAAADLFRAAAAAGTLPPLARLLAMDDGEFHAYEPRALLYSEASFLVRFLLGGERAPRFRGFLRSVAAGGDPGRRALADALGTSLESLDGPLRAWVAAATGAGAGAGGTDAADGLTPTAAALAPSFALSAPAGELRSIARCVYA